MEYLSFLLLRDIYSLYYKQMTIVNDDSSIISQWSCKLTDGTRVLNYNRNMFIAQATGGQGYSIISIFNYKQWKGIKCKQSTRWQHLSRLKASAFFSLQTFFTCYETQQLILGTGTAIWWVTEPHCNFKSSQIFRQLE